MKPQRETEHQGFTPHQVGHPLRFGSNLTHQLRPHNAKRNAGYLHVHLGRDDQYAEYSMMMHDA